MQTTPSVEHNLFIMILSDGQFAQIAVSNTHGGTKERIVPTPDINAASAGGQDHWRRWLKYGVLVPVTVERKVTIIPG